VLPLAFCRKHRVKTGYSQSPERDAENAMFFVSNLLSSSQAGRRGFESPLPLHLFNKRARAAFSSCSAARRSWTWPPPWCKRQSPSRSRSAATFGSILASWPRLAWVQRNTRIRPIGHWRYYTPDLTVTCSETCSTTAEMRYKGAAHCTPKTEFSAIYDPEIVS
jgi:hypothetical protein